MNEKLERRLLVTKLTTGPDPIPDAEAAELTTSFISAILSLEKGFADDFLSIFSVPGLGGRRLAKVLGALVFLTSSSINENGIYALLASNGDSGTRAEERVVINILSSLSQLLKWDYELVHLLFSDPTIGNVALVNLVNNMENSYLDIVDIIDRYGMADAMAYIRNVLSGRVVCADKNGKPVIIPVQEA